MDDILNNDEINKLINYYKSRNIEDTNVESSSLINNLKDDENQNNDNLNNENQNNKNQNDNIYENHKINDIDMGNVDDNLINEIILDEKLYNNKFILYFKNILRDKNEPNISEILNYYLKNYFSNNSKLITLIKLIKILIILVVVIGFFLPRQFLPFYILLIIKLLVFYDIFDNKYYLTIILDKMKSKNNILFHEDINNIKLILYFFLFLSIFGIIFDKYNFYNLTYICINKLKKYNI